MYFTLVRTMLLTQADLEIITSFLKDNKSFLSTGDLKKLETFAEKIALLIRNGIKKSQFGEHYKSCVWSDDKATSGPDTCVCVSITYQYRDALKCIDHYKTIYENLLARMDHVKL